MNTIYSILAFTFVLGIIVLVHELGHYIAARLMDVRVETFSFGLGKRLFGKKIGETDFRVSIIPLGGFVKMAGEEETDSQDPQPYEFRSKNRAQKIFILSMGPIMNFILAFIILTVINISGVRIDKYKTDLPRIGFVEERSPAKEAGLQRGDLILKIKGRKISTWKDLELIIGSNPDEELDVEFQRNGRIEQTQLKVMAVSRYNLGYIGIYWEQEPEIDLIRDFAKKAGLKNRDVVISINNTKISNYFEMRDIVSRNPEIPLLFRIKRGNEFLDLTIIPEKVNQIGVIGVFPRISVIYINYGFFEAMQKSVSKIAKLSFLIFDDVKRMIVGKLSPKNISGPIEIARFSHEAFKSGFSNFFILIAIISLNLGIINLLPIPVLDGGHLLIYTVEAATRKELSARVKSILMNFGFFILVALMIFIILNDIAKNLPNGWNSFLPF